MPHHQGIRGLTRQLRAWQVLRRVAQRLRELYNVQVTTAAMDCCRHINAYVQCSRTRLSHMHDRCATMRHIFYCKARGKTGLKKAVIQKSTFKGTITPSHICISDFPKQPLCYHVVCGKACRLPVSRAIARPIRLKATFPASTGSRICGERAYP